MTSTTPVFTRPISATERLYLATAPLAEPFAIQLVVEGAGDIDVDALRRAVELASHACPGARLVRRGKNWVDSGLARTSTSSNTAAWTSPRSMRTPS